MKIVYEHNFTQLPHVSIVLVDWSVRESYHILDYLNNQTLPREQYEIIWIEYYSKVSKEIEEKIKKYVDSGKSPPVNKWIVMNISQKTYYHKHLMYNIGIIVSKGKIVCFCDSDAIVSQTFIESIISEFEKDENIVLHMDEVRNINKKFYPFNYPSIEEVIMSDCINLIDGKPAGLVDKSDTLHIRNYGACMCALRSDLIAIGGADEDMDYLGWACGPYEMTFRMVNFGKKEVWHQKEWLYHTWHPGQAGDRNYEGPHDGMRISLPAIVARETGRVFPLVENSAIKMLRTKKNGNYSLNSLLLQSIEGERIGNWEEDKIFNWKLKLWNSIFKNLNLMKQTETNPFKEKNVDKFSIIFYGYKFIKVNLELYPVVFKMFLKQLSVRIRIKLMIDVGDEKGKYNIFAFKVFKVSFKKVYKFLEFIRVMLRYNRIVIGKCWAALHKLTLYGENKVAIVGAGSIAEILCVLSKYKSVSITGIYDDAKNKRKLLKWNILPVESLKNSNEYVIIAEVVDIDNMKDILKKVGIKNDKIIML